MDDQEAQTPYDLGQVNAAYEISRRILDLDKRNKEGLWLGTKWDLLPHAAQLAIRYAEEVANGNSPEQPPPDPGQTSGNLT